jgi:hypothetical protein
MRCWKKQSFSFPHYKHINAKAEYVQPFLLKNKIGITKKKRLIENISVAKNGINILQL